MTKKQGQNTRSKRELRAQTGGMQGWLQQQKELEASTNFAISQVVKYVIRGRTQTEVACKMCVSRSALASLINMKPGATVKRVWPLELMTSVARVTGHSLTDIIAAAERLRRCPNLPVSVAWENRFQREEAKDNLQDLIYEAVGYDRASDPSGVVGALYKAEDLKYAVPGWYKACLAGDLQDEDIRRALQRAVNIHRDGDSVPFWAAVKLAVEEK